MKYLTCAGVFSRTTDTVLELEINYRQLIPEDKMDEVIQVLKKNFLARNRSGIWRPTST